MLNMFSMCKHQSQKFKPIWTPSTELTSSPPHRRSPPVQAEPYSLKKEHHLIPLLPVSPNIITKFPNSSSIVWIKPKGVWTLGIISKINSWSAGIKALKVRALIPLTELYITVTRTKKNDEGSRTHRRRGDHNFRYVFMNLLLWISFLLNLFLLPSSSMLESKSEIEKSWKWSFEFAWVGLRFWSLKLRVNWWFLNEWKREEWWMNNMNYTYKGRANRGFKLY